MTIRYSLRVARQLRDRAEGGGGGAGARGSGGAGSGDGTGGSGAQGSGQGGGSGGGSGASSGAGGEGSGGDGSEGTAGSGAGGGQSSGPPTAEDFVRQGQALERERSLRRDAERRATEGKRAQDRVAELENAGKSEVEQAEAKGKREGRAEATTEFNRRLIRSEARALAGEKTAERARFRDPQLVVRLLDLDDVTVTDAGDVDHDPIQKQLAELAKNQPYLLDQQDAPGQHDGGTQSGAAQNGAGHAGGGQNGHGASGRPKPDRTQGAGGGRATAGAEAGRAEAERRFGKRTTTT